MIILHYHSEQYTIPYGLLWSAHLVQGHCSSILLAPTFLLFHTHNFMR